MQKENRDCLSQSLPLGIQTSYFQLHRCIVFDEVSSLRFEDRSGELQGFLKSYLEAGKASLADTNIVSSCGLGLAGNITLTEDMQPVNEDFRTVLPDIFRSSAMLDRFHLFIPGWKLPKISEGQIYYGWAIDAEVFSEYLHYMRTETSSHRIFDELVQYDKMHTYFRHAKSVRKIASAYCKLLFPHIKSLDGLSPEDLSTFKMLYREFCLMPAVQTRSYIYEQCKLIDSEFKSNVMPEFIIPDHLPAAGDIYDPVSDSDGDEPDMADY